ncbi:hypothetical protein SAMN05421874_12318 [Nonomuraea maritima]|uniref:Uncharacterized protein n=1 Tax=Nonomuraea maritima TaxID=683260 RepID=A0A1G9KPS8_9ACTN|nr:hypothetical protein [Nonomuraea maritima]SDL51596.1 hypothetical protein SAMN05421874_12318 [Nonomuraea maritima]
MPKFRDMLEYAAEIAPVIGAAHVNVHAAAARAVAELSEASDVHPGLLSDLRFVLPLRPLSRRDLAAVLRYGDPAEHAAAAGEHLREGTLTEDAGGLLLLTAKGAEFVRRLYELHETAAGQVWPGDDLPGLAALVGRVLDAAERLPGGALDVVAPPYEPDGAGPGLLLFNRLAVLRYHRADAHAAAWTAAGLSASEIVGLADGPLRSRIEAETNRLAGQPYGVLNADERAALYEGLLRLV